MYKKLSAVLLLVLAPLYLLMPQSALAVTCAAAGFVDNGSGRCIGFITAGTTSFVIPADWSDTNQVECVGSGGNGSARQTSAIGGTGGGAGAYAKRVNIAALTGTITVSVGAAGATASTTFNSATAGKEVVCDWGRSGSTSVAGTGGQTNASIGTTKVAGGGGFKPASGDAGGGGGGSGGPSGAGTTATTQTGGSSDNGTVTTSATQGSTGGSGTQFDATHGTGAGGTGGSGSGNRNGGPGGTYGGGGAGSNSGAAALGGAGKAGLLVIIYTPTNNAPSVVSNTPADGATGQTTTPTLEFAGTDSESNDIRYNIQIDTVNTFDSGALIDKVSGTDAGFANTVAGGDTDPFTSGQKASYTVQAANTLSVGVYYWRVRGIDPSGSNTYGSYATTRSFTVSGSTYKARLRNQIMKLINSTFKLKL